MNGKLVCTLMMQESADKFLKEHEDILLNTYGDYRSKYAAVVKKENGSENGYAIEVGFHPLKTFDKSFEDSDSTHLYNINIFKNLFKHKNEGLRHEVDCGDIQFKPINNIKYHVEDIRGESIRKYKKITGGVSVFDKGLRISSGTAGAFFTVKNDESIYMLSNFHVLLYQTGNVGDEIVHPSKADGSGASEVIGEIFWKGGMKDGEMDAAIAKINYPVNIGKYNRCNIPFEGIMAPKNDDIIRKCGKKTGLTDGEIRSTNCTFDISTLENENEFNRHRNQVLTTKMSMPGDSGSVIVNEQNKVVGLIYAGDEVSVSFAIDITKIFDKVQQDHPEFIFETFV